MHTDDSTAVFSIRKTFDEFMSGRSASSLVSSKLNFDASLNVSDEQSSKPLGMFDFVLLVDLGSCCQLNAEEYLGVNISRNFEFVRLSYLTVGLQVRKFPAEFFQKFL
jgi:hypothetical protein